MKNSIPTKILLDTDIGLVGPRLSEETFFQSLDLDYPGMKGVKDALENNDLNVACKVFADHVRNRTHPCWYYMPGDQPQLSERPNNPDIKLADSCVNQIFTEVGLTHQFDGEIDWTFNPTTVERSGYDEDHEWTWQFSRHRWWPALGKAYWDTGEEKYIQCFVSQMVHWIQHNPVPDEAANLPFSRWRTIEAGIRMGQIWPKIFYYALSSPSFDDRALLTMVRSMVEHARYLMKYPQRGNWLCMEMNGLYHVGALLPELKEAEQWRTFAAERLRKEMDIQVYPDGAQVELTPGYHNVSLDNFACVHEIARLNNYSLPEDYMSCLEKMYDYNLLLMTPDRSLPVFNDSWPTNVRVINNIFGRDNGGYPDRVEVRISAGQFAVWTGNTWGDTGLPVK